ncbi:MAG TPA: glucosidase [Bryobacteraceae bacterium]|nr:glucosidase [Bryobacteraceae bacterium]
MVDVRSAERARLAQAEQQKQHWRRWGTYVSDRAWGTVREDYSPNGAAWDYFPFEHAHLRAFRWSEDALLGWCDNHQRVCFGLSLWNGKDRILKERLYGLSGPQGNHSEDVKEIYYYLDGTPTHSYNKALYKYPQAEFPYSRLLEESRRLSRADPEFELIDTGIFDGDRYFDIFVEYAKADIDDTRVRITVTNRGPEAAKLTILPTVWFRNTWTWGRSRNVRPSLYAASDDTVQLREPTLGEYLFYCPGTKKLLFTENEGNSQSLWGVPNRGFTKDAFAQYIIEGNPVAVNPARTGTKACGLYEWELAAGESRSVTLRLAPADAAAGPSDNTVFEQRIAEANAFYDSVPSVPLSADGTSVCRQAFAGLLWTKQFYHYVVEEWMEGDPNTPPPPPGRRRVRNTDWQHLFNADIISMPDKWEYPWYAAWDLAFHMVPFAMIDADFAKRQMSLFLREWYMHPNGQIPAYEWALGDVNPPVHAWACWRIYQIDRRLNGNADYAFLERCFHKLLMNFTWWVNRKDTLGNNIFEGGFLGLDNIGVFDRSAPLPTGGTIEQSDGTSWMAMYSLNMLTIALELAQQNNSYEDIASKFFEHFLYIASAANGRTSDSLWDEEDGFYYDLLRLPSGEWFRMKVRSMVGIIPLFAMETIEPTVIDKLPGFRRRMQWFLRNRPDLCGNLASMTERGMGERRMLSLVGPGRLRRILERVLNESEFLSPHGVRALSRVHAESPYSLKVDGATYEVRYEPAESSTGLFGGNSNWRGPVWFPVNYLLIESLQRFHHYLGEDFRVEFPAGSGNRLDLWEVAAELSQRLSSLYLRGANGERPGLGPHPKFQSDPHFRDHLLFYEYFHGDTGAGLGASHQTGWTALIAKLLMQNGE